MQVIAERMCNFFVTHSFIFGFYFASIFANLQVYTRIA